MGTTVDPAQDSRLPRLRVQDRLSPGCYAVGAVRHEQLVVGAANPVVHFGAVQPDLRVAVLR
jgi:hypothetical protein